MIQLRVELENEFVYLDLYELDPPALTKKFEAFDTFQPQSDYSQTFRVPASNKNYKVFKTAFDINGIDYDVTKTLNATILFKGQEYISGELRLNKIYKSYKNSKTDYELIFFGATRSFASELGNKKIVDLNLTELTHTQNMTVVKKSWEAFPANIDLNGVTFSASFDRGLTFSSPDVPAGTIIYPLVDFGNTYDSNELVEQVSISVGNNQHITQGNTTIVPIVSRLNNRRFKPMVRVKYIFDKIFEEAGFTYESSFLNDESSSLQRLYLSAWGSDTIAVESDSYNTRCVISENLIYPDNIVEEPLVFTPLYDTIVFDWYDSWDNTLGVWTNKKPGTNEVRIRYQIYGEFDGVPSTNPNIVQYEIFKNDTEVLLDTLVNYPQNQPLDFYYDQTLTLNENDTIKIVITKYNSKELTIFTNIFSSVSESDVILNSLIDQDYKQIDFIKDVLLMYKLVMVPDLENENKFFIEPWSDYIGSGEVLDWSQKLDLSTDVQLSPLFLEQTSEINFTTVEDKDWLNDLNQKNFKENFGDLIVDSESKLLKDSKTIKLNYSATPVSEIQGANESTGNLAESGKDNIVIPHIYTLEPGANRLLKKPIKSKPRFLFYNGMKYTGRTFNGPNSSSDTTGKWYWRNDNDTGGESLLYPQVSPYEYTFDPAGLNYTPGQQALYLNWQAENGYLRFGQLNPGFSLYNIYWANYINLLYNNESRRFEATFVLDSQDLFNFKFSDVIFVKDTYFFVEKIEGIKLGEKNKCKVSLIKLINYVPDPENFVSPYDYLEWQEVDVNWEVLDSLWEQV